MTDEAGSGLNILIDWANQQDAWVRAAVGEVIVTRRDIPEAKLDQLYEQFLVEKGLTLGDPVQVPALGPGAVAPDNEAPLQLVRLSDVENVNRLAPKQKIDFHPVLTVLYGENAAGKTGYVRILKRVASVRSAGRILPNVGGPAPSTPPHASLIYRLGADETTLQWNDETGVPPLTRLDIFDSTEGEQKVVALADFLAETSLKKSPAPIIFDDPVTSLDHRRVSYVADRVLQLSATRQVVVLTHNIIFLKGLAARVEDGNAECSFFLVEEGNGSWGVVTPGLPRLDTFGRVRGKLKAAIQNANKATGEERAAFIERGYELLRNACELLVEQDLLCGLTERLQPHLRMTALGKIKTGALAPAIAIVDPIYQKACRYIASHSQPGETLASRPPLNELEDDWNNVQQAREAYRKAP